MKVTRISAQKKSGRYNVEVDGEFWFGLSEVSLSRSGFYSGKDVTSDLLEKVARDEIFFRVYDRCIGKISRRPHSEKEISRYIRDLFYKNRSKWFKKTSFEDDSAELEAEIQTEVLGKLIAQKLVSDFDFAQWWIKSRFNSKPRGWMLISQELIKKGVSRELLNELQVSKEKELDMARRVAEKILKGRNIERKKIIARLQSKGFSWDIIEIVVNDCGLE
ncbi:RecX family transcriptional regulator [Candidatus Dojkabacteria bacterium]|nr:RecX family transcriptional regulator [Candidatus Dojkabacteria bacterium]